MPTLTDMIDTAEVRRCAAEWHGGQSSPLYALASSGAIVEGVADEIRRCIEGMTAPRAASPALAAILYPRAEMRRETARLSHLLTYCEAEGPRGPVEGWAEVAF